ncbi:mucin-2-like [Gigantopelta aegis]|uniref:mucin-2-like n=1 Tax=Gigantopelta aegis TaxID=1735272 RepID=UPI001B889B48|nr:mucin-2-like [Gigantopelta aegis]
MKDTWGHNEKSIARMTIIYSNTSHATSSHRPGYIAISGTDFIVSFPNYVMKESPTNKISLYLSTPVNRNVNVTITAPEYTGSYKINFSLVLTPGSSKEFTIKRVFRMPPGTSISTRTLVITASDLIDVVGSNRDGLHGDSFNAIPDNLLGKEYMAVLVMHHKAPKDIAAFLTVSAGIRATSTRLTITFPPWVNDERVFLNGSWYGAEECAEVWLKSLETLQIQTEHDLTGTFVRASQPVAVYSGVNQTFIFQKRPKCIWSHLLDQMPPLDRAGLEYVAFDYPKRPFFRGSNCKIVTTQSNTTLIISGISKQVTKKGQYVKFTLDRSSKFYFITASKPVIVSLVSLSSSKADSKFGNPSLSILTPTDGAYQNTSFSYKMLSTSYVTIIARSNITDGIRFDHKAISAKWKPVETTKFYKAVQVKVDIAFTPHTIYHIDGDKFVAYLHTGTTCAAHAISLGISVDVINPSKNANPQCPQPTTSTAMTTTQTSTLPISTTEPQTTTVTLTSTTTSPTSSTTQTTTLPTSTTTHTTTPPTFTAKQTTTSPTSTTTQTTTLPTLTTTQTTTSPTSTTTQTTNSPTSTAKQTTTSPTSTITQTTTSPTSTTKQTTTSPTSTTKQTTTSPTYTTKQTTTSPTSTTKQTTTSPTSTTKQTTTSPTYTTKQTTTSPTSTTKQTTTSPTYTTTQTTTSLTSTTTQTTTSPTSITTQTTISPTSTAKQTTTSPTSTTTQTTTSPTSITTQTTISPTSTAKQTTTSPTSTIRQTTTVPTSTTKQTTTSPTSTTKQTTTSPTYTTTQTTTSPTSTIKQTTTSPTYTTKQTTTSPTSTAKQTTTSPTSTAKQTTTSPTPTITQTTALSTYTTITMDSSNTKPTTALSTYSTTNIQTSTPPTSTPRTDTTTTTLTTAFSTDTTVTRATSALESSTTTTSHTSSLSSDTTTTQTTTSHVGTTESCQVSTSVPGDGVDNDCDGRTDEETCCRNREPAVGPFTCLCPRARMLGNKPPLHVVRCRK